MEQNWNNNNNNSNYNYNGYTGYTGAGPEVVTARPEKKKGKFAKAVAIAAAVAVVGGSAGFGGALLATKIGTSSPASSNNDNNDGGRVVASYNIDDEKKDDAVHDNSISSAMDAISESEGGGNKVMATSVTASGANGEYTASELYNAVNDTIVLIKVYKKQNSSNVFSYYDYYFGYGDSNKDKSDDEPKLSAFGSGIIFTDDGYVLTNAHIADKADKLVVVVNDYKDDQITYEYEAKVVGSDTSSDIAVLKIERDEKFLAAKLGDSDSLKVGQEVCAIGNPGITEKIMFAHTMTKGIVSGLDIECLADNGYSLSLIQTDAPINSGNSGGGLFDMYGNVVGVVNSKIIATTYEGIGFALTINEAKPIMEDLLTYGYVKSRPVLGITSVELNEYRAELYGTKLSQGLLVSTIKEDAPVAKSGLRIADIITKINGKNVTSVNDVQLIISKFKAGDTVTATVARENSSGGVDSIEIDIVLTEKGKE